MVSGQAVYITGFDLGEYGVISAGLAAVVYERIRNRLVQGLVGLGNVVKKVQARVIMVNLRTILCISGEGTDMNMVEYQMETGLKALLTPIINMSQEELETSLVKAKRYLLREHSCLLSESLSNSEDLFQTNGQIIHVGERAAKSVYQMSTFVSLLRLKILKGARLVYESYQNLSQGTGLNKSDTIGEKAILVILNT